MNECVNLGTFETGEGRFELKGGFQESSKGGFGSGVRMRGVHGIQISNVILDQL
jgi:hypothetical protein